MFTGNKTAREIAILTAGASWSVTVDQVAAHLHITDTETIETARSLTSTLMTRQEEVLDSADFLMPCSGLCGLGIRMCHGEQGPEPFRAGSYVESDGLVYHEPDCSPIPQATLASAPGNRA